MMVFRYNDGKRILRWSRSEKIRKFHTITSSSLSFFIGSRVSECLFYTDLKAIKFKWNSEFAVTVWHTLIFSFFSLLVFFLENITLTLFIFVGYLCLQSKLEPIKFNILEKKKQCMPLDEIKKIFSATLLRKVNFFMLLCGCSLLLSLEFYLLSSRLEPAIQILRTKFFVHTVPYVLHFKT